MEGGVPMDDFEKATDPGHVIRELLNKNNWTQIDLARVTNRPIPAINEVIQGKRAITTDMAVSLSAAFGIDAEAWLALDNRRQLAMFQCDTEEITNMAALFKAAPVKDLENRQWINPSNNAMELAAELRKFYGHDVLETPPRFSGVPRRADSQLTPTQIAWSHRVRCIARSMLVGEFDPKRMPECRTALRKLIGYPQYVAKVPDVLRRFGIRFVVVQPFTGDRVDGVALWLDETSPVIGMSLKHDRMDNFWFVLFHEWSHVHNHDEESFDEDLTGDDITLTVPPAFERRADADAAAALIDPAEMKSFVERVGPLYSHDRIVQFALRMKVHPSIVLGQLCFRHEVKYGSYKDLSAKIRAIVASTAGPDGWGHTIGS
jgi:HTH-type transcriptional regulator / antitoxin HigA